jgi:hypothetical protein
MNWLFAVTTGVVSGRPIIRYGRHGWSHFFTFPFSDSSRWKQRPWNRGRWLFRPLELLRTGPAPAHRWQGHLLRRRLTGGVPDNAGATWTRNRFVYGLNNFVLDCCLRAGPWRWIQELAHAPRLSYTQATVVYFKCPPNSGGPCPLL